MYKRKSFREIIIESSVIISSVLIFFGFLKQYWFYDYFGIKIQHYLELDEVVIMFLGELPFVIKLILGGAIYLVILLIIIKICCYLKDKGSVANSEKKLFDNYDEFFSHKNNLLVILIISIILNILCVLLFIYNHSEVTIIYLTLISCQTLYLLIDLLELGIDRQSTNAIVLIGSLSIMLYCKNKIDIEEILNSHNNIECILIENDQTFTDKPLILIGKTKGFLFLYDKSNRLSKIVKSEKVSQLEIRNKQ